MDRFVRRRVVIEPGDARPFDDSEWADALVIVERGEVDLECRNGGRLRFIAGDILWLTRMPVRALRNPGDERTVLVAVARRGQDVKVRL